MNFINFHFKTEVTSDHSHLHIAFISGLPLSRQKKIQTFRDQIAGNMSNKCTFINPNSPLASHIKMNYSTNKVQVSYFIELPQSNFADYRNFLTFP